jgi:glycosyltransferase involved in cell wall biosynthesis
VPVSTASRSLFKEQHPVAPVEGVDPLASRRDALPGSASAPSVKGNLRLGFACIWEPVAQHTWSGSASGLLEQLSLRTDTTDLGVHFPSLPRTALKALHTHYRCGRLTTSWSYSRVTHAYVAHSLEQSLRRHRTDGGLDAVLTIDAVADLREPFFAYTDTSWDLLMSGYVSPRQYADLRLLTLRETLGERDRQLAIFERAAGIIAETHWLARSLVEQSGVPADKIHVVPPGRVVRETALDPLSSRVPGHPGDRIAVRRSENGAHRRKLLFVGRLYEPYDFYRKGGDLVVEALQILRKEYDPQTTLTMVGIDKWPLPEEPPEGVDVRGVVSRDEMARLYASHDLFVMPSRMEPFGLVFAEALGQGLPCVARNACAMPEIVTPGVSGALIDKDDSNELAEAIASVLIDDELYKSCAARASAITEYFSWSRAAKGITDVISREIK